MTTGGRRRDGANRNGPAVPAWPVGGRGCGIGRRRRAAGRGGNSQAARAALDSMTLAEASAANGGRSEDVRDRGQRRPGGHDERRSNTTSEVAAQGSRRGILGREKWPVPATAADGHLRFACRGADDPRMIVTSSPPACRRARDAVQHAVRRGSKSSATSRASSTRSSPRGSTRKAARRSSCSRRRRRPTTSGHGPAVTCQPRLLPGTEELVADLQITHYEALDRHAWDEIEVLDRSTGSASALGRLRSLPT